jgi:hypothetical protein
MVKEIRLIFLTSENWTKKISRGCSPFVQQKKCGVTDKLRARNSTS